MNHRTTYLICLVLLGLLGASQAAGQMIMRHGGDGEGDGDVVFLRELGVIAGVHGDSDEVHLIAILPDVDREIPLEKGDLVLMINGQRIHDMATLREAYEGTVVGETIKLGFRRGDERFLTSFDKKDPEEEGGAVRMVVAAGPGGDFDDLHPLHEFGVLIAEKDGKVFVAMELPMGTPALKKDDVVQSINGQKVGSLEDFRQVYEPLAIGDEIELVALRGGDEVSAARAKSEQEGMIRMRRPH
jgi:S1-C subfamily serine protease